MKLNDTLEHIIFFHIAHYQLEKIIEWKNNGNRTFPIDIITAKKSALNGVFKHIELHERKLVYIRYGEYYYIIGAHMDIQYQVLEAIIEGIKKKFDESFKGFPVEVIKQNGEKGFIKIIPEIINNVVSNDIKAVRAPCRICNKTYKVYVKKTLIKEAEHYPVSLVYFHEGHGLLLYLDADFQIRGAELVSMTG